MRWLVTVVCVVVTAVAPVGASASEAEKPASAKITVNDDVVASSSTPPPWLRLELDPSGFETTPLTSRLRRSESGLSNKKRGRNVAIGVSVTLVVVIGITAAASVTAVNRAFEDF